MGQDCQNFEVIIQVKVVPYLFSTTPQENLFKYTLEFIGHQLIIGIMMFTTEFFYRGFLLFGLREGLGKWSILGQSIPYTILHIGKPILEVNFSFFGGLVYGYIDYKTGSILPSFLLHFITSILFDIFVLI